ncbi:MAG: ATP-binding protein [Myxococcales bacterium]|nr:ATP-binding protein [Myxococcales bacterium]MCB9651084.1 ATP-binding protein [Deltaproteobacteria bacterium]
MARLSLVIGPVGAGKSTFVTHLRQRRGAVDMNLDAWMATLYGADERPAEGRVAWYLERRDRCLRQIWDTAVRALNAGTEVVLEVGLIRRDERARFYQQVDATAHPLTVFLLDAPREERRARVARRNAARGETFAMEVPMEVFELASDLWEPPEQDERQAREIVEVMDVATPDGALTWLYPGV